MALSKEMIDSAALRKSIVEERLQVYQKVNSIYDEKKNLQKVAENALSQLRQRENQFLRQYFNNISREELQKRFLELHTRGYGLEKLSNETMDNIVTRYSRLYKQTFEKNEKLFKEFINSDSFQRLVDNTVSN